mmetsp:Transcript_58679/g.80028  ORF Transcript_58679/g.80028 Transcript_58679/m.80028 type:complete len:134 (-) Transcript_58679:3225-3626(-)
MESLLPTRPETRVGVDMTAPQPRMSWSHPYWGTVVAKGKKTAQHAYIWQGPSIQSKRAPPHHHHHDHDHTVKNELSSLRYRTSSIINVIIVHTAVARSIATPCLIQKSELFAPHLRSTLMTKDGLSLLPDLTG